MCFDPNDSVENYYEDGEGKKYKLTDEILDRQIYDGTSKKKLIFEKKLGRLNSLILFLIFFLLNINLNLTIISLFFIFPILLYKTE